MIDCCPDSLVLQLQHLSADDGTSFVLTGFNNSLASEWMLLYKTKYSKKQNKVKYTPQD